MANRTIVVPNDYVLTDGEIKMILESSERGKRAEVGADLELSWQRGHMTKKMLNLRGKDGPPLVSSGVSIWRVEF
jgi:hypothetical protein